MLLLIAGITGELGQRLARAALSSGLQVRGLGRSPDKLHPDISKDLDAFINCESCYDIPAIDKAVGGVDAVICAYRADPLLNIDGGLLLLRAAERAHVKVFVAPTWNSNWTRIKYGDFELYDSVLAFKDHAATTSSIRPVYIINGFFADYLMAPGLGPFESDGKSAQFHYWGDLHKKKIPWTPMDDAAKWTIELLKDPAVAEGKGGIFQLQSGSHSFEELAQIYEKASGIKIDFVCDGSAKNLEDALTTARKEMGRPRWTEYLWLAWSHIALQGLWELQNPIVFKGAWPPTAFDEVLRKRGIWKQST